MNNISLIWKFDADLGFSLCAKAMPLASSETRMELSHVGGTKSTTSNESSLS